MMKKYILRTAIIAFLFAPALASAATYYIDPSAPTNGNGSQASPFNTWTSVSFQPGNTYLQKAGTTYTGADLVVSGVNGTASAPVIIDRYGSGAAPVIQGYAVAIQASSYVTFKNFTVTQATAYAGINIGGVSHHITVENNTISNSGPNSIAISSYPAAFNTGGCNNVIKNNTITNSTGNGISPWGVNCAPGSETLIIGNTITGSAIHGMEIEADYYIIDGNIIRDGGRVSGGTSGIHLYGGGFEGGTLDYMGSYNTVRNNVVYYTKEPEFNDGNGIQLDLGTHDNLVHNNLLFSNDGAGINNYGSWNNNIYRNTLFNNTINQRYPHTLGNFVTSNDTVRFPNLPGNIAFVDNVIIASYQNSKAIHVDSKVISQQMVFGGNYAIKTGTGTNIYRWDNDFGDNQTTWNNTYDPGGGDDTFGTIPVNNIAVTPLPADAFVIPTADALTFNLNGQSVTLVGWRADTELYVRYNNGGGDTTPPVISSVMSSSITASGANITWTTNEAADTQVEFGPTPNYGSQSDLVPTLTTSHAQYLAGLSANTTYHYRVKSRDAAGNLGVSGDNVFTTSSTPPSDTQPPNPITDLSASSVTQNSALLSWTAPSDPPSGGAVASYYIYYTTTPDWTTILEATNEPAPAAPGTSQSYTLTGLSPGTVYYTAMKTVDAAWNASDNSNTVSFTTQAATPPASLTAHWKFDNDVTDSAGGDDNGTLTGATFVAGKYNQALSFDGSGDYVNVPDKNHFSPSVNDLTISAWAKVPVNTSSRGNGACSGTGRYFAAKGGVINFANNWEWGFENDRNNRLCFSTWTLDGSIHARAGVSRTMNDNEWHHYAATIDGGVAVKLYVDGALVATQTVFSGSMGNGTHSLQIGRRGDGNYFIGQLDDVRTYSRALSDLEIKTLYDGGTVAEAQSRTDWAVIWRSDRGPTGTFSRGGPRGRRGLKGESWGW